MSSIVKYLLALQVFLIIVVPAGFAETFYVGSVMKVTLRTGPGVEHKIIDMLKSGKPLEMIEENSDWSRVRTDKGKEGWVLTRFITKDTPLVYIVNELKQKNSEYAEMVEDLKNKNAEFNQIKETLTRVEKSYNRLKKESAEFLNLEEKYKKATSRYKEQQDRIAELEKSLGNEEVKWFLSGSGVLVVGIFLGLSARKKEKSSLL
ncbi:MAG: TIGR04211 family SH3 domain-containing protein [Thermodesulfobacteriota bacterium]|nr:TIGR04211 family SH3 domain-containing protein [Thermodesulfobacteriota bacterium]